jgi:hypothetical protein
MELRTRKIWASALLAAAVMALAPGRAVAQGMEPGELKRITDGSAGVPITDLGDLKARMESFSIGVGTATDPGEVKALTESFAYEVPEVRVLEPGELKAIAEAPARFAVVDPSELKALMEQGTKPLSSDDVSGSATSDGLAWTSAGFVVLLLLLVAGAAILVNRRRRDRVAPA